LNFLGGSLDYNDEAIKNVAKRMLGGQQQVISWIQKYIDRSR